VGQGHLCIITQIFSEASRRLSSLEGMSQVCMQLVNLCHHSTSLIPDQRLNPIFATNSDGLKGMGRFGCHDRIEVASFHSVQSKGSMDNSVSATTMLNV
jgi:hypothetical protein